MSTAVKNVPILLDSAPLGVRALAAARDLAEHLAVAVDLAAMVFPAGSTVNLQIEEDPEAEGKWIVMDWGLPTSGDEALRYYQRFVTEWNALAPPWVGNFLRATFHLA
jgi:hypothetical protein